MLAWSVARESGSTFAVTDQVDGGLRTGEAEGGETVEQSRWLHVDCRFSMGLEQGQGGIPWASCTAHEVE